MNRLFMFLALFLAAGTLSSQNAYKFSVIKENPITSVKNQASTGTCWSFSAAGMLESELIRMGKGEFNLSEMYIVRKNYEDKARKYARLHGSLNFTAGGSFADVMETIDDFGIMPEDAYPGLNYGADNHDHGELDKVLKGYMDGIIGARALSPVWHEGFSGVLDTYLGAVPDTFMYDGKQYTPHSFAEFLGLNQNDYISLTSFTHHPFYKPFAIEVPDNWRWALSYNLPVDELMEVMEHAIMNGFTIAWASDVSETGFSREGIAIVPDEQAAENAGSDEARWLGLSSRERDANLRMRVGSEALAEKQITQEMRQSAFDNYSTTDDHGMQIYGIAKDQQGNKFYMVKNSWGETGPYKGLWYASDPFVRYKTLSIVLHKGALPAETARKLGL
ncbi:aminopeptidase C [Proteiniphilum sp. UBA1028]|jgi:aminopeptidase C|uniref:aminopeptidase C n=1 Tax=Proteiniphilum sp. UBA1028 TaxID=1947251 RepID=UPI000E8B150A|nr:C1 family peptidase [Proteiniphilum sp. UBA1028]HBG57625.1 aminopeptidase [Porphyromonadaceae bacterium]